MLLSHMERRDFDFLIIGAGIIGLSIAEVLSLRYPRAAIAILEKEGQVAQHGSGRNSGVLHAGIYYAESSLKARFCAAGNLFWREFCRKRNLPINECGKLIVATTLDEIPRLEELRRRAESNGGAAKMVSAEQARKIEPNIKHLGDALFSPLTATVDPVMLSTALYSELQERGVSFLFESQAIEWDGHSIITTNGRLKAEKYINAAGLYSDRIAHSFGFGKEFEILPFKGLYLKYTKNKVDIRTNIYPVPDPAFPFLGVHFTKTVDGTIKIGPTAIPAFWRENYSAFENFSLPEFLQIASREVKLFLSNRFHFRDLAFMEMRKYSKPYFVRLAQRLVEHIDVDGFTEYTAPGIRAQLLNKISGELVQDFIVAGDRQSVHILNAVSPGLTCSMPFAEYVVEKHC